MQTFADRSHMTSQQVSQEAVPDKLDRRGKRQLARSVFSASLGNALEYFDFALYGLATALVFNPLFFPDVSPAIGMLASFATFGVGFFARAFGGIVLGFYGDKLGRKTVLLFTIGLMGVSTALIGLLPTYDQIGIWAPVLLVLLRMTQGFGTGAELAGASVLLAESAPPQNRNFITSFISFGSNIGIMGATGVWLLVSMLPEDALLSWGWRIPFLCSIVVMLYTLWMRRRIEESPIFEARESLQERLSVREYFPALFKSDGKAILRSLGFRVGESGPSTFYQVFLIGYAATVVGVDKSVVTSALLVVSTTLFAIIPAVGWLSDKVGRRPIQQGAALFAAVWVFVAIILVNTGSVLAVYLAIFGGYAVGVVSMTVVQFAYLPELFGSQARYGGLAASRELGAMLSGGLVPFVCAGISAISDSWIPIAVYIAALPTISFLVGLRTPETRGRSLLDASGPR
ncbi:MFS transporter [Mycolicibacterium boenickei]